MLGLGLIKRCVKLIYFKSKDTRILLFLVEQYTIKTDIIMYYLLLNSTTLKHYN